MYYWYMLLIEQGHYPLHPKNAYIKYIEQQQLVPYTINMENT